MPRPKKNTEENQTNTNTETVEKNEIKNEFKSEENLNESNQKELPESFLFKYLLSQLNKDDIKQKYVNPTVDTLGNTLESVINHSKKYKQHIQEFTKENPRKVIYGTLISAYVGYKLYKKFKK